MADSTTVTIQSISVRYPTLMDFDDEAQRALLNVLILEAEVDVTEPIYGDLRARGVQLLAVHRFKRQEAEGDGDGSSFPLSAATVDRVSMTFVVPPPDAILPTNLHYYTTQQGVELMELTRRVNSGPVVVSSA